MNRELALKVADAVLYEGYMLYPYRPSALKNRQRWTFGILYPPEYHEVRSGTERSSMHSECLLQAKPGCHISVEARFLHLVRTPAAARDGEFGCKNESLEEVTPRSLEFRPDIWTERSQRFEFDFPDSCSNRAGLGTQAALHGTLTVITQSIARDLLKISVDLSNETQLPAPPDRDSALPSALLSAHLILSAGGGEFVSLLDPTDALREHAQACRQIGNFPVLAGTEGERAMMLCSPIILCDYPQVAAESAGDFYDSTEMDEMLTLRVMTLSEQEKNEMRSAGDRVRALLERTEQTAREQLIKTHGTIRGLRPVIDPAHLPKIRSPENRE
jgi:hypothetical protein